MKRKIAVSVVGCAAVAAVALPATAVARTQLVWAGGTPNFQKSLFKHAAEANDFFPHTVTIAQGDTIEWQGMSIGFHSIDLPGTGSSDLPLFLPTGSKASGLNDFAGNPFWFNGQPNLGFNPTLFAPSGGNSYDGSTRVDAGLPLGPAAPFKVSFTKPGTYVYFCDVHYDMRGIIVVRPTGAQTPSASAAQNAAAIAAQQTRDAKIAATLLKTKQKGNGVSVGLAGRHNVEVLGMFPSTLRVKKGATVSFAMATLTGETHTATFGPKPYLKPLAQSIGGPTPIATSLYPSSPTGPLLVPGSHGNGFANAGALDRDSSTPLPPGKKFKFTKPGTYHYFCLIHPFMHGTIVVK
jgi:plastocyanin